jgi:flavin-binding protein dodecin
MTIVKVIEVISEGKTIDEAVKAAVSEAAKTVEYIRQVNVEHIEGLVENSKVVKFRVNAKISFLVNHDVPKAKKK